MFRKIILDLGDGYNISAVKEENDTVVTLTHETNIIGKAHLTTDNVDVSSITSVSIDDKHVGYKFNDQHTLGEVLIKFLIKFPTIVRKPEFRFILEGTDNLKPAIEKYHFNRGEGSSLENEILIRKSSTFPEYRAPEKIIFKRDINADKLSGLLAFLKHNA